MTTSVEGLAALGPSGTRRWPGEVWLVSPTEAQSPANSHSGSAPLASSPRVPLVNPGVLSGAQVEQGKRKRREVLGAPLIQRLSRNIQGPSGGRAAQGASRSLAPPGW